MGRRALVLGASGQIGLAVSRTLVEQGWSVLAAHRGGHPLTETDAIRGVALDRDDDAALRRAVGGGVDALIDVIAFQPEHARQLLTLQADVGAFVVISTASVYCDIKGRTLDEAGTSGFPAFRVPITETDPTVAPGPQTYSTRKAAIEQVMLQESRRPVSILRPAAVYGAGSKHAREWWFIKRMLDRRDRIPLAYAGESRFHTAAAINIAALCKTALDNPGTRLLNIADPVAPSVLEIGQIIAATLGVSPQFVGLSGAPRGSVGATPWSIPRPVVLDTSAASALGYDALGAYSDLAPSACHATINAACAGWREAFPVLAGYPYDLFDYSAEDKVLPPA